MVLLDAIDAKPTSILTFSSVMKVDKQPAIFVCFRMTCLRFITVRLMNTESEMIENRDLSCNLGLIS